MASFPYVYLCKKILTSPPKPLVRIENSLAEMVIRWPIINIAKRNLISLKTWLPGVVDNRDNKDFKILLL